MKLANHKAVVVAAIAGMVIGVVASTTIRMGDANAATSSSFVLTGQLAVPGGAPMSRFEDKEYNIVCYGYPASGFFSCTKK